MPTQNPTIVFKDTFDKPWSLDCNVQTVADIERETGVLIYTILDDQCAPLQQLLSTPAVLANCVYLMLVGNDPVTPQEFARGIKGDALDRMVNAFLEAITDFFPDARRREAIKKLREAWNMTNEQALATLDREFAKVDPKTVSEQALAQLAKKSTDKKHTSKLKRGKSPGSSEST